MYLIAASILVFCQEAFSLPTHFPASDTGWGPEDVPAAPVGLQGMELDQIYQMRADLDDPYLGFNPPALKDRIEAGFSENEEEEVDDVVKDEAPKPYHNDRDHIIFLHGLSKNFLPRNEDYAEHDKLLDQAIHALGEKNIFADEIAHMHVHKDAPTAPLAKTKMEQDDDKHPHTKQTLQKFMEKEHAGPRVGAHRWAYQNLRGGKPAIDDRPHPLNFTFNMTIEEYAVWDKRKRVFTFMLFLLSPLLVFKILSWMSNVSLWDFLMDLWDKFKDALGLVCEEYVCEEEIIEEEEIIIKEPTPPPTPSPPYISPVIPEPPPKKPPPTPKPKPPPPPPPPKKPPPPKPPSTPSSYDTPPLEKCCPCIPTDSEETFDDTIAYPCGEDPCEFAQPVRYCTSAELLAIKRAKEAQENPPEEEDDIPG